MALHLALLLSAWFVSASLSCSSGPCSDNDTTQTTAYTVDHNPLRGRNVILDAAGRERVFRGVNVGVEFWRGDQRPSDPAHYEDGRCPSAAGSINQPPVCGVDAGRGKWNQSTSFASKNDLAQMRALGFNLIRLAISWSLLEPSPLHYSQSYLDRIGQVVAWAAEQDIEVIIDMHQDEYGPRVGSDGAPDWACLNVSLPAWLELIWPKVSKEIPFSKQVLLSFDALYTNQKVASTGKGLQEHFILAWYQVVNRFDSVQNVIGYEIINEPPPGILTTADSLDEIPVLGFSTKFLFPMYRRFIQGITGVRDGMRDCSPAQPIGEDCAHPDLQLNSRKLIFFEPMALRNELDFSLQVSTPFTEYSNIVFSPHVYTNFFTAKNWPPNYRLALDSAWLEASLLRASVLVTEFGGSSSAADKVANITAQLDTHRGTSGTMWTWKERGNWGMFESPELDTDPNGPLKQVRVQINSRIYARAVAGQILKHEFDHRTGSFQLTALRAGKETKPTEIYIPAHLNSTQPAVSGAATLESVQMQPDGSSVVVVQPLTGLYHVTVGISTINEVVDVPEYRGISIGALSRVAQMIWPSFNSSYESRPIEVRNADLQTALDRVSEEALTDLQFAPVRV